MLARLGEQGIVSMLLEGGATLAGAFAGAGSDRQVRLLPRPPAARGLRARMFRGMGRPLDRPGGGAERRTMRCGSARDFRVTAYPRAG